MTARVPMAARVKPLKPLPYLQGSQYQGMGGLGGSTLSNPQTYGSPPSPLPSLPTLPPQASAPPPAPTGGSGYDFNSDPILAQIKGMNATTVADAENQATEQRRKLLLGFGSQELARKVLGANDPTIGAISDNPDTSLSVLAQLSRKLREDTHNSDEADNQANLFYSGARVKHLSDLEHGHQADIANATSTAQSRLDDLTNWLLGVKQNAQNALLQAEADAYGRAIQEGQASGYGAYTGDEPTQYTYSPSGFTGIAQPANNYLLAPGIYTDENHPAVQNSLSALSNYWQSLGAPTTVKQSARVAKLRALPGF